MLTRSCKVIVQIRKVGFGSSMRTYSGNDVRYPHGYKEDVMGENVRVGDAGASWHASNVMSWSHVVAYFFSFLIHRFLAQIGITKDHDSLLGDEATICFVETRMFSSCFVVAYFRLQEHLV